MLTCNVVKDLLPNYIDNLVSEKTAHEIADHLTSCADCRSAYEKMKAPLAPIVMQDKNEIDFLKKIKIKGRIRTLKYTAICTGVVVALMAVFFLIFARGTPVNSADLDYRAVVDTNGDFVIEMTLEKSSALSVSMEMIYEGEGEARKLKGFILTPRQMPEFIAEGNRYSFGVSGDSIDDFQNGKFLLSIQFADKTVELTADDFKRD